MRLSKLLNLGLIAAGAAASIAPLRRRARWESANRQAFIVLDYEDALSVCLRSGLAFREFLERAREHGATHVSLPELTLARLFVEGRIFPIPASSSGGLADNGRGHRSHSDPDPAHRRLCLTSGDAGLLSHVTRELAARVPGCEAQVVPAGGEIGGGGEGEGASSVLLEVPMSSLRSSLITLRGHLPTLAEMGLGFEADVAAEIVLSGLGVVARPVSFSWPEDHLIERTMAQAAGLGAKIIAFDGDLILGHEMHLEKSLECLERFDLTFAYFAETRHQKGDWFVAKRRAAQGKVVLAHYFTPQAMVPEDFHSAAHHWGMLARARGIRLCYINVFRRIHATDPLECLHYLEHIREELEEAGLSLAPARPMPGEVDRGPSRSEMARIALAPAGAASLAVSETLRLPDSAALALSLTASAAAAALPSLDRPRGRLEQAYPPSYAQKLLALVGAAVAPVAAARAAEAPLPALLGTVYVQAGMAAALAALTSGCDYHLRVEDYRSLNADLFVPFAAAVAREVKDPKGRLLTIAGLIVAWAVANRRSRDLMAGLDLDLAAAHTHHLSAAQRLIGDALILVGPRPGRKWAGIGLAGIAVAPLLRKAGQSELAIAASLAGAAGNALMLTAFRRPERPLKETLPLVGKSWAAGGGLALALALIGPRLGRRG